MAVYIMFAQLPKYPKQEQGCRHWVPKIQISCLKDLLIRWEITLLVHLESLLHDAWWMLVWVQRDTIVKSRSQNHRIWKYWTDYSTGIG